MLKRTHLFVGTAAALACADTHSLPILVAGAAAGALGGILPDIDSGTSDTHKDADIAIALSVAAVGTVIVLDAVFKMGIWNRLMKNSTISRMLTGLFLFLIVCAFGKEQPHRGFMHSFVACLILTEAVRIMFPSMPLYFAAGFLSHMAIDLLNKKGEKLFWPAKKGFCMKVCKSSGVVNEWLMYIGMVCTIGLFLIRLISRA